MTNLKTITLDLENCEHISFPGNVIGDLKLDGIHRHIQRVACNAFDDYETADHIFVEIFSEGNVDYNPFDFEDEKTSKFERIRRYADITSVTLEFEGKDPISFLTCYDSGQDDGSDMLGAENINQKTKVSELGNLYIVISAERKLEDYVDWEMANDKVHVDFVKDMYDIGEEEYPVEDLSETNLPDFYRHVYLFEYGEDGFEKTVGAMRVPDKKLGWRFEFLNDPLHFPTKWQYCPDKISKFVDEHYASANFTSEKMKELYPLLPNANITWD